MESSSCFLSLTESFPLTSVGLRFSSPLLLKLCHEFNRLWDLWDVQGLGYSDSYFAQISLNTYNIATVRNIGKKQNKKMLSVPQQTKIKLLASMSRRTLSLMHYKTRFQYLYICSLGHKITHPSHGIKHTEHMKIWDSGLYPPAKIKMYIYFQ